MFRFYASRVVATVANTFTSLNISNKKTETYPVRALHQAANPEQAIAINVVSLGPFQARASSLCSAN